MSNKYADGNQESVTANIPTWGIECQRAAQDDEFFKIFRRSEIFLQVIEGTSLIGGLSNLRRLLKDSNFLSSLKEIQKSDYFGGPLNLIEFFDADGFQAYLTPTTIRYANNACNVLTLFGKQIFENEIYEIGGGYGGECKVFKDISLSIFGNDISWHIYDLPSSTSIITKWLGIFGYNVKFEDISQNKDILPNSFVISCGALSEIRGDLLKAYIDDVVLRATYGYFITNFDSHSKPFGGWSTDEFISYLRKNGKADIRELDARTWLSYYDFDAGSRLIVFGAKSISNKTQIRDYVIYKIIAKIRGLERRIVRWWLR